MITEIAAVIFFGLVLVSLAISNVATAIRSVAIALSEIATAIKSNDYE